LGQIALRFVPRFTIWDLCRTFGAIFMQNSNVYYRSSQMFLPFIPVEVMDEVLDETDMSLDASGFDYVRLGEQLEAFLQQNILFVSISFKSLCFSRKKGEQHLCIFTQEDQKTFFNSAQFKTIIENMLKILENFENLILVIEDEPVEDHFLVQERLKLLYARINDRFIPYLSHHPHLVQVIWKKVADDLTSSLKKYNRAAVATKLREVIKILEKEHIDFG